MTEWNHLEISLQWEIVITPATEANDQGVKARITFVWQKKKKFCQIVIIIWLWSFDCCLTRSICYNLLITWLDCIIRLLMDYWNCRMKNCARGLTESETRTYPLILLMQTPSPSSFLVGSSTQAWALLLQFKNGKPLGMYHGFPSRCIFSLVGRRCLEPGSWFIS